MKNVYLLKTLVVVFLLVILFFPSLIFANNGLIPCGGPNQPCELCHLFELFDNIVRFVMFSLVPPIAVLMLVIGGIYFYFSAGDPEKTKQAVNLIKATVIGMLIIYFSWSIVVAIFTAIGAVDWNISGGISNWRDFYSIVDCK